MKHALITLTALACLVLTAQATPQENDQAAPVLDLGARVQPLPAANRFAEEGWFVWCGAPVLGGDGKYHLFYSRWPVEVGFAPGWAIHSQIAYAVADHPFGPYRHVNLALPPRGINPATGRKYWDADVTHNSNAFYHNGKYYLYYMGNHGDGKSYAMHRNNQRIGLAVAERPEGPWKRLDAPIVDVSPDRTAFDSLCVTNPAACLRPDGGVLLVYKAVEIIEGKTMGGKVRHGVALADHPEGTYVKQPGRIFEADQPGKHWMVAEDPFIWHSRKYGNRYYAITRDVVGAFTGSEGGISLFQSEDGLDWKPAANPKVLEARYHLTGGKRGITKLERPALLIENGEPTYLFGAADGYLPQGRISSNVQIPLAPPDAGSHETVPAPQGAINGGAWLWYDKPAADWNAALPPGWPTGSVRGLRARGGFEVDITWKDGALTQATIRSTQGGKAVVVAGGKRQNLELAAGKSKNIGALSRIPSI